MLRMRSSDIRMTKRPFELLWMSRSHYWSFFCYDSLLRKLDDVSWLRMISDWGGQRECTGGRTSMEHAYGGKSPSPCTKWRAESVGREATERVVHPWAAFLRRICPWKVSGNTRRLEKKRGAPAVGGNKYMHPSIPQSALHSHSYPASGDSEREILCFDLLKRPVEDKEKGGRTPCGGFWRTLLCLWGGGGLGLQGLVHGITQRLVQQVPPEPSGILNNWLRQKHLNDDEQMASFTWAACQ